MVAEGAAFGHCHVCEKLPARTTPAYWPSALHNRPKVLAIARTWAENRNMNLMEKQFSLNRRASRKQFNISLFALIASAFTGIATAQPFFSPTTGSWYDVVSILGPGPNTVSWSAAQTGAMAASYLGMTGRLATITSQAENDFIVGVLPPNSPDAYWIGGMQVGGPEPADEWQWITGEPWAFSNWAAGEPNNAVANEDFLILYGPSGFGKWNDARNDASYYTAGYVIEYALVPEPSILAIVGLGTVSLFFWRRGRILA